MRRLVFNADDFGMSHEHNLGVLQAHESGSITAASLMMGEVGTEEAVAMARKTPTLAVGLHIALSDATPVLPPEQIRSLVDDNGRFHKNESKLLLASFTPSGRRQIRAEIRAQFDAYQATGLPLDHINTHRHSHQLPTVATILFAEARRRNVKVSRLTLDPLREVHVLSDMARLIRFYIVRHIMRSSGITTIYLSIGRDTPGHQWTPTTLLDVLRRIPPTITELYFHPVILPNHRYAIDVDTLIDEVVVNAIVELRRQSVPEIFSPSTPDLSHCT